MVHSHPTQATRRFAILTILVGCGDGSTVSPSRQAEVQPQSSLIVQADRQHDFGPVIGRPGQKMDHRYRLVNASPRDVKLLEVINRKSCCGIISVGAPVLHPGDATDVTVTLIVGDKFGGVVHETEVVTDQPSDSSIVLRTSAMAHPAFRFEEMPTPGEASVMGDGQTRRADFRAIATGTTADPVADLDRLELRSALKAEWSGPKVDLGTEDGLTTHARRFTAWLDLTGSAGDRTAEILLGDGKAVLTRHVLAWEVVPPISASPKVLVVRAATREYQVVVQARDRKPFRITSIDCKASGVEAKPASDVPASTQIVKIGCSSRPAEGRGTVTLSTDHPGSETVDIPLVFLD